MRAETAADDHARYLRRELLVRGVEVPLSRCAEIAARHLDDARARASERPTKAILLDIAIREIGREKVKE